MQVINTNVSSLNSQRHLNNTQAALSTTLERLSSGKRINNAKDDAAGLGISERMTSQINGMNQAIRNARDGISMSQTAEGALSTSNEMLQRIRTLAVQSSNATNNSIDRQALQDEVNELTAELDRIAQTTSFNGRNLLDGTLGTQNYQVGANAGELITASGSNFRTSVYGVNRRYSVAATIAKGASLQDTAVVVNGRLGTGTAMNFKTAGTAKAAASLVNAQTNNTGVTATAKTEALFAGAANTSYSFDIQSNNTTAVTVTFAVTTTDADGYAAGINAINAVSAKTGVTAEYDASLGTNGIRLTNASGETIKLTNQSTTTEGNLYQIKYDSSTDDATALAAVAMTKKADADTAADTFSVVGTLTFDSEAGFNVSASATDMGSAPAISEMKSVSTLDVTDFKKAQLAISICDAAINRVTKEMSRYGAMQSRFDATVKNLQVTSENTSNARSRIKDADYAAETAELSRATILQQAGTSMLAQANQRPQTVLSLLG